MKRTAAGRDVARRIERHLGPICALLLGLSLAFFCYAMPAGLVARGVAALGLPPALANARLMLALLPGIAAGAAVLVLFRRIDRAPAAPPRPRAAIAHHGAPQLRRADAHPDAPARRPIFAAADLGPPLDLVDPLPAGEPAPQPVVEDLPVMPAITATPEGPVRQPLPFPVAARLVPVPREPPRPAPVAERPAAAPPPELAAMMTRLEAGLARKALVMAGADANVTPLKREIRPIDGPLADAVDRLDRHATIRR